MDQPKGMMIVQYFLINKRPPSERRKTSFVYCVLHRRSCPELSWSTFSDQLPVGGFTWSQCWTHRKCGCYYGWHSLVCSMSKIFKKKWWCLKHFAGVGTVMAKVKDITCFTCTATAANPMKCTRPEYQGTFKACKGEPLVPANTCYKSVNTKTGGDLVN